VRFKIEVGDEVVFPPFEFHVTSLAGLSPLALPDVEPTVRRLFREVFRSIPASLFVEVEEHLPDVVDRSSSIEVHLVVQNSPRDVREKWVASVENLVQVFLCLVEPFVLGVRRNATSKWSIFARLRNQSLGRESLLVKMTVGYATSFDGCHESLPEVPKRVDALDLLFGDVGDDVREHGVDIPQRADLVLADVVGVGAPLTRSSETSRKTNSENLSFPASDSPNM